MRTSASLIVMIFIGIAQLRAAELENVFIRKPGHYTLDANGSTLTIDQKGLDTWTLAILWARGEGTSSSVTPHDCLRAEGWFVFVEKPGRVWVFDGVDAGVFLSNTEKESGATMLYFSPNFSQKAMTSYPKKFRDALPQKIRSKNGKIEPTTKSPN